MSIALHQLRPPFLEAEKISGSGIWGHECNFVKGKNIQIVAPSGSGKTSLIHFMYGLRKDHGGEIAINGESLRIITAEKLAVLRTKCVSIVFQDLRLFAAQTALQNIEVKTQQTYCKTRAQIEEMASHLGIRNKLNQPAGNCSFGEQQRIAIIRALQQPFDFILLDEPFSHLDDANSEKALQLIEQEASERNAAIILADLEVNDHCSAYQTFYL